MSRKEEEATHAVIGRSKRPTGYGVHSHHQHQQRSIYQLPINPNQLKAFFRDGAWRIRRSARCLINIDVDVGGLRVYIATLVV